MMIKLRRLAIPVIATLGAALGIVGLTGSPASAAGTCSNVSPYSFSVVTQTHNVFVSVFKGSGCGGSRILDAQVQYDSGSTPFYFVDAYDDSCDNIGFHVEMHGYAIASTGCSNPGGNGTVNVSSIGSPRNFWLYVNGTTNSPAYNLPT